VNQDRFCYNLAMQNYSWYTNKPDHQSSDYIHQTLAFGSIKDIQNLKKEIGEKKLVKLFLQEPKKVYTAPSLNLISKFILHLKSVNEQKYLKFTHRNIR